MVKLVDEMFARYVRTQDADALAFVFEQTASALARRARRLVGDARAAEDLVQDLFLSLLAGSVAWDPTRPCRPWLVGALHRRAARWHRNGGRWPLDPLPNGLHGGERSPDQSASDRELLAAVRAAMVALPPASRDVVHRYVELHETPQEIGRALGRAPGTVRVQLHRGLHALRDRLPAGFLALVLAMIVRPAPAAPMSVVRPLPHAVRAWLAIAAALLVLVAAVRVTASPPVPIAAGAIASAGGAERGAREAAAADVAAQRIAVGAAPATASGRFVLRHADGSPAREIGVMFGRAGHDPDFGWQHAVSDAAGAIAFATAPIGEVELTTDRGTCTSFALGAGANRDLVVDLPAGVDVSGRVVDAAGNAVAQAGIWIAHQPRCPWDGLVATHADDDGRFVLRSLAPMSTFAACVAGRAPSPVQRVGSNARTDMLLRVGDRGALLAGVVRALDGSPVAGAVVRIGRHVRARFVIAGGDEFLELLPPASVVTGADGRFACEDLPAGRHEVCVRAPAFAAALRPVELAAGERREIEVRMRPGGGVRGVVRAEDGGPVALAMVTARGRAPHEWSGVHTATDGSFELAGVAAERAAILVEAEGFVLQEVTLPAPVPEVVDVVLQRVRQRRGRLVTAVGETADAASWELACRCDHLGDHLPPALLPVAADGSFDAASPEGSRHLCRPRGTCVWLPCTVRRDDATALELVLPDAPAACTLELRLSGFTPAQLADARVMLQYRDEFYSPQDAADGGGVVRVSVPPGDYGVFVMSPRGACPTCSAGVAVVRGDTSHDVVAPPSGVLRYGPGARARIEHWRAFVIHESGMQAPLLRPNGTVALAAGRYTLWAGGLSFMTVRGLPFEVRAGEETLLEVPVRPGILRHVAFDLPAGARADTAVATLRRDGEIVLSGEPGLEDRGFDADAGGSCVASLALGDGTYDLEVRDAGKRWLGRFALGGEDGVIEPLVVPLRAMP